MKKTSYKEVEKAAQTLSVSLEAKDWLPKVAVGVGKKDDLFVLEIRMAKTSDLRGIPDMFEGIPVRIVQQDMPVAL